MKVRVWSGDQKIYLGTGEYTEDVTVYCIVMPDGDIISLENAEERPSDEVVMEKGGEISVVENNPKIVLANGEVVYGCQVWWEEAISH